MSIVGPRPCLPSTFKDRDDHAKRRFAVKPGLTGLAQVNGNASIEWANRWQYDVYYVEQRSVLMDLKIISKTVLVVLLVKNGSRNYSTMRILLIGSVESTPRTLLKLIEHRLNVVGVMGYQPNNVDRVSGYVDLAPDARAASIPFQSFRNINDHKGEIASLKPDIVFVVGLSQLIASDIVSLPQYGCVGFHPTQLPAGRGRAPLAWLVLEQLSGAATFFHIGEGVDDGPIYVQQPFHISELDDVESVCEKLFHAMDIALDHWLPDLAAGMLHSAPQDPSQSSWYARRTPKDGDRPVDELWIAWCEQPRDCIQEHSVSAKIHES